MTALEGKLLKGKLLEGKVVLISGGTQGVGRGIAEAAAANGGTVVVTGRRPETGEATVAAIREAGGEALYLKADVALASS